MVVIMKLCKANYEETKNVMIESIYRFLYYINEYCSEYAWLNDNMEKYAEESKGRVEEFIAEHNIDMKEWMKQKKYYDYKYIATDILNHIDDIHQKIIEVFIEPKMEYPVKILEWMHYFRFFCYGDNTKGEFLSLQDQNEMLKKYPHFDVSMKKPKCLGDFNMEKLFIYKDEKSMNIQPTTEYMKSIPRRPSNKIYCPECNRILCPATDKCICGQIIEWVG